MDVSTTNYRTISISLYDALRSIIYDVVVFKLNGSKFKLVPLYRYLKEHKTLPGIENIIYSPMLLYIPPNFFKCLTPSDIYSIWIKNEIYGLNNTIKLPSFDDDVIYLLIKYIFLNKPIKSLFIAFPELMLINRDELKNMLVELALEGEENGY